MKQLNLNKLLSQALDLHRNGSIDKADEIYLEILKIILMILTLIIYMA
jgi:hypothetical protein